MEWLRQILPTLATAAGGPLAGVAASFIGQKLGAPEATVDEIRERVTGATPEQLVELKRIDAELQQFFANLGIEPERIAAADRASARDREVRSGDVWTPRVLAYGISLGFMFVLGWLVVMGKPAEGGDVMLVMLGTLGTAWTAVVQYYFGSSTSSRDKSEVLASLSMHRKTDIA